MANLTIRDVPKDVHEGVKQAAQAKGMSVNSYVVSLLKEDAEEQQRRRLMRERWPEFRKFVDSLPAMSDSTPLIREDRDRGHE